jgi:hypothetical protein
MDTKGPFHRISVDGYRVNTEYAVGGICELLLPWSWCRQLVVYHRSVLMAGVLPPSSNHTSLFHFQNILTMCIQGFYRTHCLIRSVGLDRKVYVSSNRYPRQQISQTLTSTTNCHLAAALPRRLIYAFSRRQLTRGSLICLPDPQLPALCLPPRNPRALIRTPGCSNFSSYHYILPASQPLASACPIRYGRGTLSASRCMRPTGPQQWRQRRGWAAVGLRCR